jgi:hypothetical protein
MGPLIFDVNNPPMWFNLLGASAPRRCGDRVCHPTKAVAGA